jgi:transposase InsO family protein
VNPRTPAGFLSLSPFQSRKIYSTATSSLTHLIVVWTSDITYIQTDAGWLYLAVVLDLYSRQVVGWSMQSCMQSSLVIDVLKMVWFRRRPEPGLIFYPDRGSQHCSHAFQNTLAEYGMPYTSMSRKANCWDNALVESLRGSLKVGDCRFEVCRYLFPVDLSLDRCASCISASCRGLHVQ